MYSDFGGPKLYTIMGSYPPLPLSTLPAVGLRGNHQGQRHGFESKLTSDKICRRGEQCFVDIALFG